MDGKERTTEHVEAELEDLHALEQAAMAAASQGDAEAALAAAIFARLIAERHQRLKALRDTTNEPAEPT